jgi:energy-coupling factor transporter ATP-binding protein EcfA2
MSGVAQHTTTIAVAPLVVPSVARIAKIALSDYRAFPSGQVYEFNLGREGKNLLLFGENGSGKTSLFRALRDLTAPKIDPQTFADLRHIYAPGDEGFISVELTAGTPSDFRWQYGEAHPRETAGEPYRQFAERCRFLDYRALLETHFVHRTASPNLFTLLVREVLPDLPVLVRGKEERLSTVYARMISSKPVDHRPKDKLQLADEACEDFSNALTNHLPEVVREARRLIEKMGYEGLVFDLKPGKVTFDRIRRSFVGQEVGLAVTLFGKPIDHPQLFLNEARLTALALAICLGAANLVLKSTIAGADGTIKTRLLVLDDVLIGLDLANRLPVLKILNEDFADWQVILMTYDRVWFDLAKEYNEHTGRWTTLQLRELSMAPGYPSRPHVEPCLDLLAVADSHLQAGDLMACAVYIRACFETRLKNVCHDHGVMIAYKADPKDVKTDQLWRGIVTRQQERVARGEIDFIDQPSLINDVETVRSTVLNRLSHSGMPGLVEREVRFALETIRKLQFCTFKKVRI